MQLSRHDTIAAIATPPGLGGIAVLRISGPDALRVLRALFLPAAEGQGSAEFSFRPRFLHYGHVLDCRGEMLDSVLAVYMPGPRSFTGEDVGEIHCHGGAGISAAILEAALCAGARLARPGEFTRRAFMNGRLDLTRAEAVAEMINATGREGVRLAAAKLNGALADQIGLIRERLDSMRMQVILAVDFPEEEDELLSRADFSRAAQEAAEAVQRLVQGFERARFWREGALAVLAGRVNAGKSSLLNAILGYERAIVAASPGTTRDYIEERVNLRGLPLRLMDTAGLRQGGDLVEEEGIRRSRDLAQEADILLFVLDASAAPLAEEREFLLRHKQKIGEGRMLLVLNKVDLLEGAACGCTEEQEALAGLDADLRDTLVSLGVEPHRPPCFAVSARKGTGIDFLAEGVRSALTGAMTGEREEEGKASDIAPNLRQSRLLQATLPELEALARALDAGLPPEILGVHLDAALQTLDEVTGTTDNEALLDRIFSDFCIGK